VIAHRCQPCLEVTNALAYPVVELVRTVSSSIRNAQSWLFYLFFVVVVEMEWHLTHLTPNGHSQKGSNYSTKGKPDMTHPDESEGTD
jgi:hypothetical protein